MPCRVGCRAENQRHDRKPVYGIVTDGKVWQFGALTSSTFTQDKGDYLTNETNQLFGAIDFVLGASL